MLTRTDSPPPSTPYCTRHDLGEGVIRMALTGGLDQFSAPEIGNMLDDALAAAAFVVLDLDELASADPAVVTMLRAAGRAGGQRLIVVNVPPHVQDSLAKGGRGPRLRIVPAA